MGSLNLPQYQAPHNDNSGLSILTALLGHALSNSAEKEKWEREQEGPRKTAIADFNARYRPPVETETPSGTSQMGDTSALQSLVLGKQSPDLTAAEPEQPKPPVMVASANPDLTGINAGAKEPEPLQSRPVVSDQGKSELEKLMLSDKSTGMQSVNDAPHNEPNPDALPASTPMANVHEAYQYETIPSIQREFMKKVKEGNMEDAANLYAAQNPYRGLKTVLSNGKYVTINQRDAYNQGGDTGVENIKPTWQPIYDPKSGIVTFTGINPYTGEKIAESGQQRPLAINLNKPNREQIQAVAYKVANGEISLKDIPARSTARMEVINELTVNPQYQGINLAEVQANIKKKQDLSLIKSNALIDGIQKPMQNMYEEAVKLDRSGFLPLGTLESKWGDIWNDPRLNGYKMYKQDIATEIRRALTNVGTITEAQIDQQMKRFDDAKSPEAIKAAIGAADVMLQSRKAAQQAPAYTTPKVNNPFASKPAAAAPAPGASGVTKRKIYNPATGQFEEAKQ